mmetsp:Transcript_27448/g.91292  ORF Transcript_27448/g.91292 Transcript_27448/m.91292 type:complete len:228 (+) Transcript_27448:698-1381(+)
MGRTRACLRLVGNRADIRAVMSPVSSRKASAVVTDVHRRLAPRRTGAQRIEQRHNGQQRRDKGSRREPGNREEDGALLVLSKCGLHRLARPQRHDAQGKTAEASYQRCLEAPAPLRLGTGTRCRANSVRRQLRPRRAEKRKRCEGRVERRRQPGEGGSVGLDKGGLGFCVRSCPGNRHCGRSGGQGGERYCERATTHEESGAGPGVAELVRPRNEEKREGQGEGERR